MPVLGIVNVIGSSIAREADYVIHTQAGPEISVATTKAYSAQLVALYMLALKIAKVNEEPYMQKLDRLPALISKVLEEKKDLQYLASRISNSSDIFFIGRGLDYAVSLEGSLKMKEISYIHSEAYPAGELKHGTISLVEDGTVVIGVLTQDDVYEKTLSNMIECKSRGAYLIALTSGQRPGLEKVADFIIRVPETESMFMASLAVIPLQLLAYYTSVYRGLDVDKPRNLAKSVTVE